VPKPKAKKATTKSRKSASPRLAKPKSLGDEEDYEGYCVKCGEKQVMEDPQQVQLKNLTFAAQGTCPNCGTKLTRMLGREPVV
jgi:predicted RNA-binding Zn-ribbon protein involved in translation (DUF1610 family)